MGIRGENSGDLPRSAIESRQLAASMATFTVPFESAVYDVKLLGFTPEALCSLTGLDVNVVERLLSSATYKPIASGEASSAKSLGFDGSTFSQMFSDVRKQFHVEAQRFADLCRKLASAVNGTEPDVLVQTLLGVLFKNYHLTADTISRYAGISVADIEAFQLNPADIPIEKRYRLGLVVQNLVLKLTDYLLHTSGLVDTAVAATPPKEYGQTRT
jgi:hypothetical protein